MQLPQTFDFGSRCDLGSGHMPLRGVTLITVLAFTVAALGAPADYRAIIQKLSEAADAEVRSGAISGATIALVADQKIICVNGFGFADKQKRTPARADTVYRAGSISKLFTALAAMQLAEQGRLNIDKPVTNCLPDFRIIVPFEDAQPITLRQLMSHRSGMVRECPVGSYFDNAEPGMQRTVASLASCALVHPPTTKTKYSNSGVTIVGRTVERVSGMPFESYQQKHLLGPLGMTNSSFLGDARIRRNLAVGYLSVAQPGGGFREVPSPVFELGTIAAGNLYTTAGDLARFVLWLLGHSEAQIVKPETLAQMFTPQFTSDTNGFGLGFSVSHYRGRKTVSHTGAVYGFTSSLAVMPSEGLGVIVLCNDDIAVGPVRKLNNLALDLLLGSRDAAPPFEAPELVSLTGDYESQSFWARVDTAQGKLIANISGQKLVLTPTGPLQFKASGRIAQEWPVAFQESAPGRIRGFTIPGQKFARVNPAVAAEAPAAWKPLIGSYGPDFIPLIVSIKYGHLYAMTENEFDNRLTPVNEHVFKMPPGLYTDEQLVFQKDRKGKVHTAILANMPLRRR
jgi:CubicO group peptidase (beta-lactamase class C family)